MLRRPVESGQYTSLEFTQVLDDHDVLQSVGSVGDAYDNSMAESFVDTLKTELIRDRVWQTRSQLELAIVEDLGWFNDSRLHESLGDLTPAEFEALYAPPVAPSIENTSSSKDSNHGVRETQPGSDRWAAADLLREVCTERFGSVDAAVASELALRYDGGPCFRSHHYQAEIDHLGMTPIRALPAAA